VLPVKLSMPCDFQNAGNELLVIYFLQRLQQHNESFLKMFSPTNFDFGKMSTEAIFMLFIAHII